MNKITIFLMLTLGSLNGTTIRLELHFKIDAISQGEIGQIGQDGRLIIEYQKNIPLHVLTANSSQFREFPTPSRIILGEQSFVFPALFLALENDVQNNFHQIRFEPGTRLRDDFPSGFTQAKFTSEDSFFNGIDHVPSSLDEWQPDQTGFELFFFYETIENSRLSTNQFSSNTLTGISMLTIPEPSTAFLSTLGAFFLAKRRRISLHKKAPVFPQRFLKS